MGAMKQNGHGLIALKVGLIVETDENQASWRPQWYGRFSASAAKVLFSARLSGINAGSSKTRAKLARSSVGSAMSD